MKHSLSLYFKLMRFHKPIGIFLLLWPSLWALWQAAGGLPPLKILGIFVLGGIIMRAAGCVINDIADRNFDKYVQRTQDRPLTTGAISVKAALILFFGLSLLAFALVLLLNSLTIQLAFVGILLSIIYPFTKRFIAFPQFILGLSFAWGIPMAYAALLNDIPTIAWLLFGITVLWILIYDTEYAMVDRDDDLKIGIKSTAILFGKFDRYWIGFFQSLMLLLLLFLGLKTQLNFLYYWLLLGVAGCMGYQQYLIYPRGPLRGPQDCFKAFLNNNWLGLFVFIAILLGQLPTILAWLKQMFNHGFTHINAIIRTFH